MLETFLRVFAFIEWQKITMSKVVGALMIVIVLYEIIQFAVDIALGRFKSNTPPESEE